MSWTAAIAAAVAVAAEPGTRWIGVDGCGGSGKSTLAAAIARETERVQVVSVDEFAGPGVPEWDWGRFAAEVVRPLLAGRAARYRRWDWRADGYAGWGEVEPGAVVVVEGVSAVRSEAAAPWDLTIWVDAPRQVRLARLRARDGVEAMARWSDDWLPSEDAYVEREHPQLRVDLVVAAAGDGTMGRS